MSVALKINEELKGIELYFENKPNQEVRKTLKSNGFRWSGYKMCWYTKQSEKALQVAESITKNKIEEVKTEKAPSKKQTKNTLNLWDATKWEEMDVNNKQETKEIAKEIRKHVRQRFPQCKFSVRTDSKGWTDSIYLSIKQSPYSKDSKYLNAIKEYCNSLVNAYNICYDAGDPYTDLPASYNFYFFNTSIDYDYKQTEQTEEVKKDIAHFDKKLEEYEKAEEKRKEKEFQEYLKQREKEQEEAKKQQKIRKNKKAHIYNSINVKSLENNDQYFIINSEFANLNKNNTLKQYENEVKKGDYSLENVKITKELHFNDKEALNYFSKMLLDDFEFLTNTGGSYTDDNRINSMTDFYNMDEDERKAVQWNLYGVAVYFNNQLQFVIDTQGYNYARYVGLTNNSKVVKFLETNQTVRENDLQELKQKVDELEDISTNVITELDIMDTWQKESWGEYKEAIKEKLKQYNFKLTKSVIQQLEIEELKQSMYKLLIEVDGIQDQFKNADIKQGDKLTLFYISDWGSIATNRITFDSVKYTSYAQYDNAVRLTFKPERKRKLYYNYFHSTLLVFKGWHSLPDDILHHVEHKNGMRITQSKYHSCDKKQYDKILEYFKQQGIKPIINTYKPQF